MHELALCDAMLKMVRDISREQALEGVRSITVRVGTLSGVVPRFLTDCWTAPRGPAAYAVNTPQSPEWSCHGRRGA